MIEEETPQPVFTELVNPSFCTGHTIDEACTEPHKSSVKCTSLNGTTCIVQGLYDGLQLTVQEYLDLKATPVYTKIDVGKEVKDYITAVKEINPFLTALATEYDKGSQFVSLNDDGSHSIVCSKTDIISLGVESVGLCRITQTELDWFNSLPHTDVLGEATDNYITSFDDINWYSDAKKIKYHNIYVRTPKSHTDENGDTIETIPPLLHGSLASKKHSIF